MENLKPCPFCGNEYPLVAHETGDYYHIECPHCQIIFYDSSAARHEKELKGMIDAWNRRYIMSNAELEARERKHKTEQQKAENAHYIDIASGVYPNDLERVYIKCKSDNGNIRIIKGFFYRNGGKPVFASYGSEVENVITWAKWDAAN